MLYDKFVNFVEDLSEGRAAPGTYPGRLSRCDEQTGRFKKYGDTLVGGRSVIYEQVKTERPKDCPKGWSKMSPEGRNNLKEQAIHFLVFANSTSGEAFADADSNQFRSGSKAGQCAFSSQLFPASPFSPGTASKEEMSQKRRKVCSRSAEMSFIALEKACRCGKRRRAAQVRPVCLCMILPT